MNSLFTIDSGMKFIPTVPGQDKIDTIRRVRQKFPSHMNISSSGMHKTISIFHGWSVWIEKSISRVSLMHRKPHLCHVQAGW